MVSRRFGVVVAVCGLVACGGPRDEAAPAAASTAPAAEAPAAPEAPSAAPAPPEPEVAAAPTPAEPPPPAPAAADAPAPAAKAEVWTTDEKLDITWSYEGVVARKMDGDTLVVTGEGLPEIRVLRRATPADVAEPERVVTGLGDRYFGPVWIQCTTSATGDAAAQAEAFCASIRPVDHAKLEVLGCEAPAPHDAQVAAALAKEEPAFLDCMRSARGAQPILSVIEGGLQFRFTADGVPVRVGHNTDISDLAASRVYDDCVFRLLKTFIYDKADGSEVNARCTLRVSLYR